MSKKVVLGISGGVDSSVAAYLLKKEGYEVIGLFMKNWQDSDDDKCTAYQDSEDAMRVSQNLGIKFYQVNFEKEYKERVFSYFLEELQNGRTPNPDVMCNREIKFDVFLNYALKLGADYIAMGHYAKVTEYKGRFYLEKPEDKDKDQTYFLSRISEYALSKTLFPLADLNKTKVREIAEKENFVTAKKKDSTGICFIGERNFDKFLDKFLLSEKGPIKSVEGQILGEHKGLIHYTIGQRKGIGLGGIGTGEPFFVVKKSLAENTLYVAQGENHKARFVERVKVKDFSLISKTKDKLPEKLNAKFRYRQKDIPVRVSFKDEILYLDCLEKVSGISPGQIAVLYEGNRCLGGGIIEETYGGLDEILR